MNPPPFQKKKNRKEEKGILNLFGWYAEFFDYYGIVYNSTSLFTKKKNDFHQNMNCQRIARELNHVDILAGFYGRNTALVKCAIKERYMYIELYCLAMSNELHFKLEHMTILSLSLNFIALKPLFSFK